MVTVGANAAVLVWTLACLALVGLSVVALVRWALPQRATFTFPLAAAMVVAALTVVAGIPGLLASLSALALYVVNTRRQTSDGA